MDAPEVRALHAIVRGRVQGVGFRYAAVREASRLGVRGTVRNTDDGCVEVVAEARDDRLALFLSWLEKGPPGAHVRKVDVIYRPPSGAYAGFEVEF